MAVLADEKLSDVVNRAKEVFWRRGYEEASVEELVQATGMNRYALYSAFGGKRDLFVAVLDAYFRQRSTMFMGILNDPSRKPLDAIREVTTFCIGEMVERKAGCLMGNVALEAGYNDSIVLERVHQFIGAMRQVKKMALEQASQRGELNPAISPEEGAAMLASNVIAAGSLASIGETRENLLGVFNACMKLIEKTK